MSEGKDPRPAGTGVPIYGGITPYLMVSDARKAAEFYKKAFGAEQLLEPNEYQGLVMNLQLLINGSTLMLMDPMDANGFPLKDHQGYTLHLQVTEGIDEKFQRAVDAGCTVEMPLENMFWGDRYGQLKDPFGVSWSIGQKA